MPRARGISQKSLRKCEANRPHAERPFRTVRDDAEATMLKTPPNRLLQALRGLSGPASEDADASLLERFVRDRDEAAFECFCIAMATWSFASAAGTSITPTPRMPSRPSFWCWPATRPESAAANRWPAGCSAWPISCREKRWVKPLDAKPWPFAKATASPTRSTRRPARRRARCGRGGSGRPSRSPAGPDRALLSRRP